MTVLNPEAQSWAPLPPRGSSSNRERHRERRRLPQAAAKSSSTDKEDTRSGNQKEKPKQRRVNRPGFNSYLKVLLDDKTMDILYEMAVQVQARIQESMEEQEQKEANRTTSEDIEKTEKDPPQQQQQKQSKASKRKLIRFKPRSRVSFHMTLFFGGEIICELPPNELLEWHGRVSERLGKSGFRFQDSGDDSISSTDDFSFEVVGLKVFPPQRKNLIVAILEPAPAWHVLHNDIRELAKDESCSKALAEITRYSKDKWISHITLGNLYGGTKEQLRSLDPLLQEVFQSKLPVDNDGSSNDCLAAFTSGIAMGGPVPEQLELDWDFRHVCGQAASGNGGEK
jgi:2'-5' RNA ligase